LAYADFFNLEQDPMKSTQVQDIFKRGESAARRAGSATERGLASRGFGGSTFTDPLKAQAGAIARSPFEKQAVDLSEQLRQQNISNFFQAKGFDLAEEQRERERKQREMSNWASVLGLAGNVFGGPVGGALGSFFGGQMSQDSKNLANAQAGEASQSFFEGVN